MNEGIETKIASSIDGVQAAVGGAETLQNEYLVICGLCGAVERPVGPHKTECPNCDDYIY